MLPCETRKFEAIVSMKLGICDFCHSRATAARGMVAAAMKFDSQSNAAAQPDWTYSVQRPAIFSAVWLLYMLSRLSIPIAIVGVIAAAKYLGWIDIDY